jgi:hypothetical protein
MNVKRAHYWRHGDFIRYMKILYGDMKILIEIWILLWRYEDFYWRRGNKQHHGEKCMRTTYRDNIDFFIENLIIFSHTSEDTILGTYLILGNTS